MLSPSRWPCVFVFVLSSTAVTWAADDFALRSLRPPEVVSPHGLAVPRVVDDFLAARRTPWIVVWDRDLEVPVLAFPSRSDGEDVADRGPGAVLEEIVTGLTVEDVRRRALDFIAAEASFLGLGVEDFGTLEVEALREGFIARAAQVHRGYALRGSLLRFGFDARGRVAWLALRGLRRLRDAPPLLPALGLDLEAWRAELEASGRDCVESTHFELGVEWSAGDRDPRLRLLARALVRGPEDDHELLVDASTGEVLRELGLRAGLEGQLTAITGDLDDLLARPSVLRPDPQPARGLLLERLNGAGRVISSARTDSRGEFDLPFGPMPAPSLLRLTLYRDPSDPERARRILGVADPANLDTLLNPDENLDFALQIYAAHHLDRARTEFENTIAEHGLRVRYEDPALILRGGRLDASYRPLGRLIEISTRPSTSGGELMPSILYHEIGHHYLALATRSVREADLAEGLADAYGAFLSRDPRIGHADARNPQPADWEGARNLREDRTAWPEDARTTMAGALWELWETTLDLNENDQPDSRLGSSFTRSVVALFLEGQRLPNGATGGASLHYWPHLGFWFLLASDHRSFPQADGNLQNGSLQETEVLRAFGSRNLLPVAFVRGDANESGRLELTDAIRILDWLFAGGETDCPDALDADDSGEVDLTDAVRVLGHLFLGDLALPAPFPSCGWDRSVEDGLGCWSEICGFFPLR